MRKLLGYIPLDPDEKPDAKQHVNIAGEWLKMAEVWIPGVAITRQFRAREGSLLCVHCSQTISDHKGASAECPTNVEKQFGKPKKKQNDDPGK